LTTDLLLDWSDGMPRSRHFGDIYVSRDGGLDETRHVFLRGNRLEQRFAALGSGDAFAIGETGFGTGLNFLCAWQVFDRVAPAGARLHFVSTELHPLSAADLRRCAGLWPELAAWYGPLCDAWGPLPPAFHRVVFAGGRLSSWSTANRTVSAAIRFAGDGAFGDTDSARSGLMTITGAVDLGGASRTISIDRDTTFSGAVSNGGLTKAGAARLTLSGANTYEGPTRILSGGVAFTTRDSLYNGDPSKWTSANIVTGSGVTVVLGVGGTTGFTGSDLDTLLGVLDRDASTGSLQAGGSLGFDVAAGADVSVSAAVQDTTGDGGGAIGFVKSGEGTLTLAGGNTYSGGTVVEGGALLFGSTAALPPSGSFTVQQGAAIGGGYATLADWLGGGRLATTSAGAILLTTNDSTAASFADYPAMSVGGVGDVTFSGSLTPGTGGYRLGGGPGNLTVASQLTGDSGLVVVGPGTISLTGANDFTGGTSLTGGRLVLGSAGALGTTGTIAFSGGATLVASAANTTDYSDRFSTAASQAYALDTNGQDVTLGTALTSSGGTLAKSGSGRLTLGGANTYSGGTTISAGTLVGTTATLQGGITNDATVEFSQSGAGTYS
jgi:autotransporter-associated beta strand protein